MFGFNLQPQFTFSKSLLYIFSTNFPKSTVKYARLLAVLSTSLKVPPVQLETWLKPVFKCFDRKDADACPHRELLVAYRLLSAPTMTPRERLLEAFKAYDTMWKGSISRSDILYVACPISFFGLSYHDAWTLTFSVCVCVFAVATEKYS